MCGLAGFYRPGGFSAAAATEVLARMGQSIFHRGPDQGAEWIDAEAGIGLASRRLAIIDLSPAGHQPMQSASGRYMLSYNGEIYNHREIRQELEAAGLAPAWRGSSDTETLLAATEAWGLNGALKRATGMFALALWDRQEKRLRLSRDRLGEKPMHFGWSRGTFLFGSELKSLACHPDFEGEIDRDSLAEYVEEGYVPTPRTIYRGIFKLLPGTIATVREPGEQPRMDTYWSAAETVEQGHSHPLHLSDEEALAALDSVLGDAVKSELIGDVPVGAFLSGGIDSSLIVALMQRASRRPVQTFTIGFEDRRFDEAPFARQVARHLGTDHHEITVSAEDTLAVVPRLPGMFDEPFADSSQVPTFLVSQLARSRVTVALSGDGGDELFGGYEKYLHAARLWRRMRNVPMPIRGAAGRTLQAVPRTVWNGLGNIAGMKSVHSTFSDRVAKGAGLLDAASPYEVGRGIARRWRGDTLVVGGHSDRTAAPMEGLGPIESLMAGDMVRYLPDDILAKVDRSAMAVSLETRAPYLNHKVVEFAWRLSPELRVRSGTGKWILRQLLERHVPRQLFDRPKRGFGMPVDEWLRGPLRSWAEELLSPDRLRSEGYFRPEPIREAWKAHLSGQANRQAQLWTILMFQAWLERRSQSPQVGEDSKVGAAV